jgi:hypothetical protein
MNMLHTRTTRGVNYVMVDGKTPTAIGLSLVDEGSAAKYRCEVENHIMILNHALEEMCLCLKIHGSQNGVIACYVVPISIGLRLIPRIPP